MRLPGKRESPLGLHEPAQRIDDQITELRMVELHRHAMAEVGLLARRTAEMVHRAHFLEIADRHALGPASRKLDADVGPLDAGSLARPP